MRIKSPLPFAAFVASIAAFVFAGTFIIPGCSTTFDTGDSGLYAGDGLLYRVEEKVPAAFEVVDSFLEYEFNHRDAMPEAVREFAAELRARALPAFQAMNTARDEYVAAKQSFAAAREQSAKDAALAQLDEREAALREKLDLVNWALKLATDLAARYQR